VTNTEFTSVLAVAIQKIITDNMLTLGLKAVMYGDQNQIPLSPTALVVPGPRRRDLAGVSAPGGRVDNWLTVFIDILSSAVGSESDERLKLDQISEKVEKKLHEDVQLGGLLIHGFVNEWDPGLSYLQGGQFRTSRLIYIGRSKTYLSA